MTILDKIKKAIQIIFAVLWISSSTFLIALLLSIFVSWRVHPHFDTPLPIFIIGAWCITGVLYLGWTAIVMDDEKEEKIE